MWCGWASTRTHMYVCIHMLLPVYIESSSLLCTFQGQFNFYEVVIEPQPEGCNRVLVQTKQGVDKGIDQRLALVSDQWLPMYVRLLALHANVSVSSGTWSVAGCHPPPSPHPTPLPFPHRWRVWLTGRCLDGEAQTGWSAYTRSIESSPSSGLPPHPLMGRTLCWHSQLTSHYSACDTFIAVVTVPCCGPVEPAVAVTNLQGHKPVTPAWTEWWLWLL